MCTAFNEQLAATTYLLARAKHCYITSPLHASSTSIAR